MSSNKKRKNISPTNRVTRSATRKSIFTVSPQDLQVNEPTRSKYKIILNGTKLNAPATCHKALETVEYKDPNKMVRFQYRRKQNARLGYVTREISIIFSDSSDDDDDNSDDNSLIEEINVAIENEEKK